MTHICKIPFGRRRAFDCKMSGANLCFASAFLPSPHPTPPHSTPPPCRSQVCQLPCRSELGQMVAGKKCLLAHSSEQNEQMPAEPPITVTPTGGAGEGRRRQNPAFTASSVACFHPGPFPSRRFSTSSDSGRRAQAVFPPCARHVKGFSKAKAAESRIYFPPKFWTLSFSSLFLTAFHCLHHNL